MSDNFTRTSYFLDFKVKFIQAVNNGEIKVEMAREFKTKRAAGSQNG